MANAQSHYPGQHTSRFTLQDKLKPMVYSFDLSDVKLLDSRFKENMQREQKWLLNISLKSLLHSFYINAGMYDANEGGYDELKKYAGWESPDCELRGHSTGHILSGLALMYASTGEDVYKLKGDTIIATLAAVQKTLNQDGYVSAFPQEFINRNIRGEKVWAPWYTLHKLLAGILDQYLYCNNQQTLDIAKEFSAWAYKKLKPLTAKQRTLMLRNEFGGINETFYNLYAITGNINEKWLGNFFYDNKMLEPLKTGIDNLQGTHANTFIPKLLGVTRSYEIEGNADGDATEKFFWNTVVNHHSFATGSNSDKEHFFKPDAISTHLTGYTGESCNVYNMLKLTRHLYIHSGDIKYADYYEKALYNHILGQQDTVTGMVAYFLPMLSGAYKVYSTPDSSFWCCVGTGFENQAKYGESIYYHNNDTLFVNLFIPSVLDWKDKAVKIKQQTIFPQDDKSLLIISTNKSKRLTLKLRYPSWAVSGAVIKINGRKIKVRQSAGSYIALTRTWKDGDRIEMEYPMTLRVTPAPDSPDIVSIEYGPVVLAAEMGTRNMIPPAPFSNPRLHNDYYTYDYHVPKDIFNVLNVLEKPVDEWLKPVQAQPLMFKTVKTIAGKEFTLVPLYNLNSQRYIVYWHLKQSAKN